jgi:hypothetical protein
MVFIVIDASWHRKIMADKIRNLFTSRKVIIDTVPTGAEVILAMGNTEVISSSCGKLTPLVIEKIIPGRYILILSKQGYEPVRRILISDRDKGISIDGAETNGGTEKNKFIIPFRMKLVLNSAPVGATVRIDGELINGKTPLETTVTAGVHFVKMEYKGIGSIGAKSGDGRCVIDTSKKAGQQVGIDLRFWDFSCYESSHVISEVLSGKFLKMLNVESTPEEASLYIDGGKEPVGITPVHDFLIGPGYHKIKLEKYGFVVWEKDINLKDEPGIRLKPVFKNKTNLKKAELQKETAQLPADDATLIVDTRPDFMGSKIIIDGSSAGDTLRKLIKFPRGTHTVTVKHPDLQKPAMKTVFFSKDCQIILLKMNKAGEIYESGIE